MQVSGICYLLRQKGTGEYLSALVSPKGIPRLSIYKYDAAKIWDIEQARKIVKKLKRLDLEIIRFNWLNGTVVGSED